MTDTQVHPAGVVSDERLAEMLAGIEGVTPGPWEVHDYHPPNGPYRMVVNEGRRLMCIEAIPRGTAMHLARCDPDTMRSIITELQQARSKLLAAEKALEPFSGYAVTSIHHEDGQWVIRIPDNAPQPAFSHFTAARTALNQIRGE